MSKSVTFQSLEILADKIQTCCSEEEIASLVPAVLLQAIYEAAKENGMAKTAREAGMTRAGLYKALSEDGNPSFVTVWNILSAFGYMLVPIKIHRKDVAIYSGGENENIR